MKAHDVFADDVDVSWPIFRAWAAAVEQPRCRHIVVERINPHVHDVAWIAGNRNAPIERRAGDRQVFQAHFDEAHDLVLPLGRQNEIRVCCVVREQFVLIGGEFKEIGLFFRPLNGRSCRRREALTLAQLCFGFLVVGLIAHRVPAAVLLLENIAGLLHAPP